jgi:hypothetical protein
VYSAAGPTPAPTGTFASLAIGVTHHCAVGLDDSIACWGNDMLAGRAPLVEDFVHVALADSTATGNGTGVHGCAQRPDGTLRCWGQEGSAGLEATTPTGTFTQFSVGGFESCGVRADQSALCWGDTQTGKYTPTSALYTQISLSNTSGCGLEIDGTVDCNPPVYQVDPTTKYTQLSAGSSQDCAIDASDSSLSCWGARRNGQPSGPFAQVSVSGPLSCGVRTTGELACWGSNVTSEGNPPAGTFVQVTTGGDDGSLAPRFLYACGLRTDGTATCWGDGSYGKGRVPSESFTELAAGQTYACGISTSHKLWCWGMYAAQPM